MVALIQCTFNATENLLPPHTNQENRILQNMRRRSVVWHCTDGLVDSRREFVQYIQKPDITSIVKSCTQESDQRRTTTKRFLVEEDMKRISNHNSPPLSCQFVSSCNGLRCREILSWLRSTLGYEVIEDEIERRREDELRRLTMFDFHSGLRRCSLPRLIGRLTGIHTYGTTKQVTHLLVRILRWGSLSSLW